ncbi:YgzB family protein [Virgibacillus sp. 179-BFC.A HS]|uniref:YgzB family protein n=1 Tax=Tigheibacillus jepli TaxID=3035914 RepID=A0ABU5CM46_9BACI|nr:YgzB family protein [Virgibacillus sp. 179-BFC.A HS]MDY0406887.1 YgzB family protein [Virgibacillus sp. 179-BFC.A HS]
MAKISYSSKINKIRSFALILVFAGILLMYVGIMFKKFPWVMATFFVLGMLSVIFSCVVYLWIGSLSIKAVPVVCPNCHKPTKVLGHVDACMHCNQPLTINKELEGLDFDERYNKRHFRKEALSKIKKENNQS